MMEEQGAQRTEEWSVVVTSSGGGRDEVFWRRAVPKPSDGRMQRRACKRRR